jgi:hypothetical protein
VTLPEHPEGRGRDARTSRLQWKGFLRGARWVVTSTPERLLRIGSDFLVAEGFDPRDDGYAALLDEQGSEWTAIALEIGNEERSRRGWWQGLLTDDLPFPLPRFLQPSIPPTIVVVAARPVSRSVAELVVFPHTSRRGDPTYASAAAPRISAAIERISTAAGAEGAMLSHETMRGIPDDGNPASQQMVRDVLGWR